MKIQCPPGMRDFYPDDMRLQNWVLAHWRSASLAFGFSEYEGPIFEFLDLYTLKSGDAIVSELFNFTDRGERRFAIRPEMTPTLARMVAARANALPRPIKWFSLPRMCRAERPQRGRLREFFQWNADILGSDDPLADAEVIAVAAEFLRRVGLTPQEVVIRLNHRGLAAAVLAGLGLPADQAAGALELIDRIEKLKPEEFARQWDERYAAALPAARFREFFAGATLETCAAAAQKGGESASSERNAVAAPVEQLQAVLAALGRFGLSDWCEFDFRVVRGLAYYTGVVFECHTRDGQLRALLGGGRYDDLTSLLDGPKLPGVGFGMGDAPLFEALRQFNKLPAPPEALDVYAIDADEALFPQVLEIIADLRRAGLSVDFSYKRQALGKQLKAASGRGARWAIIVGAEWRERGEVIVKDLASGAQRTEPAEALRRNPAEVLRPGST